MLDQSKHLNTRFLPADQPEADDHLRVDLPDGKWLYLSAFVGIDGVPMVHIDGYDATGARLRVTLNDVIVFDADIAEEV